MPPLSFLDAWKWRRGEELAQIINKRGLKRQDTLESISHGSLVFFQRKIALCAAAVLVVFIDIPTGASIFPGTKGLPDTPWQGAESEIQAVTPAVGAQCQDCGSFPLTLVVPLISQPSGREMGLFFG